MKNKKGQAAMEFLMTYGWAIVVVLAAIGALAYFGVLSPQKLLPERTTFQAPLPNVDNAVVDTPANTIEIAFRNNKGVAITLPLTTTLTPGSGVTCANATLAGNYNGAAIVADTTQIPNGANFLLNWTCAATTTAAVGDKFKADISFDYTNVETGQSLTQTGSVEGKYS
ncbi:MAG TPA: hypothetical protein VEC16_01990 [Alphaproteobacteria bacterium]|nr:hypothetical protein [Alphaproteobacteria bacterium]